MRIKLSSVLGILRSILNFLPGGSRHGTRLLAPFHAHIAATPYDATRVGGLYPFGGVVLDVDAELVGALGGLEGLPLDPSNVVVLIVSSDSADRVRAALGLGRA